MEFYDIFTLSRHSTRNVSIPNGMEFYGLSEFGYSDSYSFQFPTGWNSTKKRKRFATIPAFCFNSQRDGILRKVGGKFSLIELTFQFPTGWNSTVELKSFESVVDCFNSQRDGNSTWRRSAKFRASRTFQFPTGWNSTLSFRRLALARLCVSIPNGMEFYICGYCLGGWQSELFQFPTGWNSTRLCAELRTSQKTVSIPNGMEFYAEHLPYRALESRFNSQRDGILRQNYLDFKALGTLVSIPNGMEFYEMTKFAIL